MRRGIPLLLIGLAACGTSEIVDQETDRIELHRFDSPVQDPADDASTPPTVTAAEARALFDTDVVPILNAKCALCHAGDSGETPNFLGATETDFYETLVADTRYVGDPADGSLLLTYPEHAGPLSFFDSSEHSAVLGWLTQETALRFASAPPPVADPPPGETVVPATNTREALSRFGACMSQAEWESLNMGNVALQDTDDNGNCAACHSAGESGTFLSDDSAETFLTTSTRPFPYGLKYVAGTVDDDGDFAGLVVNTRLIDKGQEACDGEGCHPRYTMSDENVEAISAFVTATLARAEDLADDCTRLPWLLEAEAMTLTGYVIDPEDPTIIRLPDGTSEGTAEYRSDGPPGRYELEITIIAEQTGIPRLNVAVDGDSTGTVLYPVVTQPVEAVVLAPLMTVDLTAGSEILFTGTADTAAFARLDRVIFRAVP
ncbi:MAG: hypothetical protein AAFX94_12180 [Myxococcota bacterium]